MYIYVVRFQFSISSPTFHIFCFTDVRLSFLYTFNGYEVAFHYNYLCCTSNFLCYASSYIPTINLCIISERNVYSTHYSLFNQVHF